MGKIFGATSLTEGKTLASYDGDLLNNGDAGMVFTPEATYIYRLDASSGEPESFPNILVPSLNPGNKRWILKSKTDAPIQYVDKTLFQTIDNPTAYWTTSGDYFGVAGALNDTYSLIGAHGEEHDESAYGAGKAYMFNNETGELVRTIDHPDPSWNDHFGQGVAMTDNYYVIAAPNKTVAGTTHCGSAYIFDMTTGSLLHTLEVPGTERGDSFFGKAIAMSDSYVIVGVQNKDKVFVYNPVNGALVDTIINPETTYNDYFGYSIAMNNFYFIVGAKGGNKVYIFSLTTRELIYTIYNPTEENLELGCSVSASDSYLAVGAMRASGGGRVYVYNISTGELLYNIDNPFSPSSETDLFGVKLSITENWLLVSANVGPDGHGKVYIFKSSTGELVQTIDNPIANPSSGQFGGGEWGGVVEIKEPYYLITDYFTGDDEGIAYIYK